MSHRVKESVRVNVNKTSLRRYATATKVKPTFYQNANLFAFCWGFAVVLCVGLYPQYKHFALWYRYQHVDI